MTLKPLIAGSSKNGISSNYPDIKDALERYVKVRNQSTVESVKEKMGNIAMKAIKYTDHTSYNAVVSKLKTLPITKDGGRNRSGNTQYVGLYKLMNWERRMKGLHGLGNGKSHKVPNFSGPTPGLLKTKKNKSTAFSMQGKYKKFQQVRGNSSKFLAIGWALAAKAFGKKLTRGDFGSKTMGRLSGRAYGGGGDINLISGGKAIFKIWNGAGVFDTRKKDTPIRNSRDISEARKRQQLGLTKAIQEEIKSMYELILKRTSGAWYGKNIKVKAV